MNQCFKDRGVYEAPCCEILELIQEISFAGTNYDSTSGPVAGGKGRAGGSLQGDPDDGFDYSYDL